MKCTISVARRRSALQGDTEANAKIMFLKSCDADSEFMQFHCRCTTSSVTGQTSCVCTDTGGEVSTNLSSLTSASIAEVKYPSNTRSLQRFQ